MAMYGPALGLEGRTFELWVLNRWVFNVCVRSTHYGRQNERRLYTRKVYFAAAKLPPQFAVVRVKLLLQRARLHL